MKKIIAMSLLVLAPIFNGPVGHATASKTIRMEFESLTIEDQIRLTLVELGVSDYTVELIVAQSKHESGNYTNNLTKYHNVFARHYSKRDTLALSAGAEGEGHTKFAKYRNIREATISQYAYFLRKGYTMKWDSTDEFALELKSKSYYEAPTSEYINALNKFIVTNTPLK